MLNTIASFFTNKAFVWIALLTAPFLEGLGILLGIEYMPIKTLAMVTLLITIDFVTGLAASSKNNDEISSKRGLKSVWKLITYVMFIYITVTIEHFEGIKDSAIVGIIADYVKLSIFILAGLYETHSIGENLEKLYGEKPRIFKFMDTIAQAFENMLVRKVKNSGGYSGYLPNDYENGGFQDSPIRENDDGTTNEDDTIDAPLNGSEPDI